MAVRNDLQTALINMGKADKADLTKAVKYLGRSRDIATKYHRADAKTAKRIVFILDDARQTVQHAKDFPAFLSFVASECLKALNSGPN